MKKVYLLIFGSLFVLTTVYALVQSDFSTVEIKATKVAGSVYMLEGQGGNIGASVGRDGVLMIDNQFAPLADKITAAIEKLGGDKPKFVLNTHYHSDHTGGNARFAKDGTLIAHENVRKRLISEQKPQDGWPVITFDKSIALYLNEEKVQIIHFKNSHTDGDAIVHFAGSNVVHMGDLMFAGRFPYIDLDAGGNVAGYTKSVETILDMLPDDIKIIPGHGTLSQKADLIKYHSMLVETSQHVSTKIKAGNNLATIQSEGLPDKWQTWGSGFINEERWIETLYNSYQQDRG